MSFTYTTNYNLAVPTVGTELDAWGDDVGANFPIIDTQMKNNANAAANALSVANGKAAAVHTHAASDITSGTLAAARMPALTGDVTTTVGTVATAIAAGAVVTAKLADGNVTNAKLANMAANTVKGSVAGGVPIDLTGAQVLSVAGAAPLASPGFTGTPTAPTPAAHDSSTKLATTAFVMTEMAREPTVDQSGNYTLALTDAGGMVRMTSASANNLTVPPNSSVAVPVESLINVGQYGAGQTTIVAGAGVTIRSLGGKLKLLGQYGGVTLKKIGTDEWWAWGDLTT